MMHLGNKLRVEALEEHEGLTAHRRSAPQFVQSEQMTTRSKIRTSQAAAEGAAAPSVAEVLAWLERKGTRAQRAGLARYGIPADTAFGVPVGVVKAYGKQLGTQHELALALWKTNRYEARLLVAYIADPARITAAQLDSWGRDFDNWAVVDTLCFHLLDRLPSAHARALQWAGAKPEFTRRAGFALMWALAAHDRSASDAAFERFLPLLERGAHDERNFVKKAVDMALRSIGRRSPRLHAASRALAERLAASDDPTPRWVGKAALRGMRAPKPAKKTPSPKSPPKKAPRA